MKIPNTGNLRAGPHLSLARIVSEDSQPYTDAKTKDAKSSKDS